MSHVLSCHVPPQLKASKDARVLSVLSAGVHKAYLNYREDPELKKNFRYGPSASGWAVFASFVSQQMPAYE